MVAADTFWVDGIRGNDAHDGNSEEKQGGNQGPFKTVRKAVLSATDGDTIRIQAANGQEYDGPITLAEKKDIKITGHGGTPIIAAKIDFSPGEPNVGYGDDYGVVNLLDCKNVTLSNLKIVNHKKYTPTSTTLRDTSSCALNTARSTNVVVIDSHLKGDGKSVVLIHDNSAVTIENSKLSGYYFEVNCGASDVIIKNCVLNQHNRAVPDSHAAINTTAGYGALNGGPAKRISNVVCNDVTFNMETGRAIVTGNTNDFDYFSVVRLKNPVFRFKNSTYGLVGYHSSWFGVELILDPRNTKIPDLKDFVSANSAKPITGFGRFVNYYDPPHHPVAGRPATFSDGLSSETLFKSLKRN